MYKGNPWLRFIAAAALCASIATGQEVWAQATGSGGGGEAGAGATALEEVVVTAQKYQEDIEKSTVAVTALSGQTLQTLGVTSSMDLNTIVPNLAVTAYGAGAQLGMRGVFNSNFQETGDPTVGFMVDGVYYGRQRSALAALYDIGSVEVLRGPQGTLWGRNSIAGSINVITNKPDLNGFSAEGTLQYGNYNELLATGMVNLPADSTFGLRAAFYMERHDGYDNNAPQPRSADDLDAMAGRLEAYWKPMDNFSALLSLDSFHSGGVGGGSLTGGAPLGPYATSSGATPFDFQVPNKIVPFQDELAQDATLTLNWDLPFFSVTYVGNLRSDTFEGWDILSVQGPIVTTFGGICANISSPTCFTSPYQALDHQVSHELRLGHQSDQLKWVVGAYYFNERDTSFAGVDPCPCGAFSVDEHLTYLGNASHAAFGQATWAIIKPLRLTAGIRYNDDFTGDLGNDTAGAPGTLLPFECVGCNVIGQEYASVHFRKTTWKAGVDYDVTPDSMAYFTASTGYRDGGFNQGVQPNNEPFLPETLLNYEVGLKNTLFDRRLTLNVDAFHGLYSNYQSTAGQLIGTTIQLFTLNAAKAEIDGVEFEASALATPYDRIDMFGTWLHAYFTQFPLAHGDGFDGFAPEDLSGRSLPYAPKETIHIAYQHTFPLANSASIVPRIDTTYSSSQYEDYHNFPVSYQGSYTRTELSLTYNAPKIWNFELWVKNLENKAVLMNLNVDNSVPLALEGLYAKDGYYLPPRTYGFKLSAKF